MFSKFIFFKVISQMSILFDTNTVVVFYFPMSVISNSLYRHIYRVSHIIGPTLFFVISRVLEHLQRDFLPFFNSPGNLLHYSHKNFENWFRNSWDNWGQSWQPSFRNWHFAITQRQKNNFYVKGGNFDLNYLSYF